MSETSAERSFAGRSLDWLKEQHARHFIVEKEGRTAVELPLTVAAVGAILAPHVAILGLVLAFVTSHEIHIETPAGGAEGEAGGSAETATPEACAKGPASGHD